MGSFTFRRIRRDNTVRFSLADPAYYTEHQLIANGDYLINSKNTLAVRYFWTADPQTLADRQCDRPSRNARLR